MTRPGITPGPFTLMIAQERLYLTADGRVVREGDPAAAFLLVGAGCELDDETARRYGVTPAETKAVTAPAETKRRKR